MREDHLDPDIHLWESEPPEWWDTMQENCKRLLENLCCKNWGEFYRAVYKGTPCGPTIGILCHGQDDFAYNDDLYKFDANSPVVKVSVSSIVEGSDVEIPPLITDMKRPEAHKTFWGNVGSVNADASAEWEIANQ